MKAKQKAELVKNMVRSVFTAPKGKLLFVADFSSIEARVVMWYAREEGAIKAFEEGADIYCQMAEKIYGYPCHKYTHPEERANGKSCILGAGFGMGVKTFMATYNISDNALAQKCINAYRNGYPGVKQSWSDIEAAFRRCMHNGEDQETRFLKFRREEIAKRETIVLTLPSGRDLFYYEPELRAGDYGSEIYVKIKTSAGMFHRKTWGGDIFQDAVQGTARDLCVHGTMEVEKLGWEPIITVHDEVVSLGDEGMSLIQYNKTFSKKPEWAYGIPVGAEGWTGRYYRKD